MKIISKIILSSILFLVLFSFFTQFSKAETSESFGLTKQLTLPGDPRYSAKRFKEKLSESLKILHNSKSQYRQVLLEKRLSELVSMVDDKNVNEIANSTQRFAYQAGKLAEGSYNDNDDRKKEIMELFKDYKPILEKMRDNFPANSAFWLLSQHDINTLDILSDKLK